MSNITGNGESFSSENNTGGGGGGGGGGEEVQQQQLHGLSSAVRPPSTPVKKKRNLPGTPDPTAEVIALSPATLMATNRFVCEICNKGFQRDQNLQLHRRGHNLPWKLRQRARMEAQRRVYVCPEPSCVHHNPRRALGDLTGIKKHFSRKHGEKRWKCDKCSKKYAVRSDLKAHSKTCGTREHKCDCGTIFSRKDSFITHRAFCDAIADENSKHTASTSLLPDLPELLIPTSLAISTTTGPEISISDFNHAHHSSLAYVKHRHPIPSFPGAAMLSTTTSPSVFSLPSCSLHLSPAAGPATPNSMKSMVSNMSAAHMPATALLQKAAQMGATASMQAYNPDSSCGHGQFLDGPGPGQAEHGRFLKSFEQDMHARTGNSSNVMMVDFLGVGSAPRPVPMSLQPQHQFHHQQLSSHGQSTAVDRSM